MIIQAMPYPATGGGGSDPLGLGPNIALDPGFDDATKWVASGGWSVSGGVATGTSATNSLRQNGAFTAGKFYRVVLNYTISAGNSLRIDDNTGRRLFISSNLGNTGSGTITCFITPDGTDMLIEASSSPFSGTLTSMEVREVIYTDARLGPEKVLNGDFSSGASWSVSGGWSISGGTAVGTAATDRLEQTGVFVNGETYRLVMKVRRTGGASGTRIRLRTEANVNLFLSTGFEGATSLGTNENHAFVTTVVADGTSLRFEADSATFTGILDNISIQKVL